MTTAVKSPVTEYAEAVIRGGYVVGRLQRLACERHMRDLETGHLRGLRFDEDAADYAISYFPLLKLPDGVGAGSAFELLPWQKFIVGSIFGWIVVATGKRRFQYALIEVARANGKSPLAGGIGDFMLTADGEQGAQIYSAATTRDQAKIVFNDGVKMAEKSPDIWSLLTKTVNNLAFPQLNSFFRPLAADSSKMDGLRIHGALVDELHEHPNGEVMAKLRTGMKSTQPLLFMITTAGYDRLSVCYEEHDHGIKVLEGLIDNDAYFAFICTLDEGDDWKDEKNWPKANPSLGHTVRLDTLRQECELAVQIPGQQNSFKRLRLNVWTEQDSRWLSLDLWDANAGGAEATAMKESLRGRKAWGGLDLSSNRDLSAFSLAFPDNDGGVDVLTFPFLPEDGIEERSKSDRVPYEVWRDQEFVTATEGNSIDYDSIRKLINELADVYEIQEIGYDPWNAEQMAIKLIGDGFKMAKVHQGFSNLNAPCRELERLLLAEKLRHGNHPVLRWAASNVIVHHDPYDNIKPDKPNARSRIDPLAALLNAISRMILSEGEQWSGIYIPDDEG